MLANEIFTAPQSEDDQPIAICMNRRKKAFLLCFWWPWSALALRVAVDSRGSAPGLAKVPTLQREDDPWSGCPRIFYWDDTQGCRGTYDYLTDSSWTASDGSPRVVAHFANEFHCCHSDAFNASSRTCRASAVSGADDATCVYGDNYCPTLTVDAADPAPAVCLGGYTQNDNNLWTGDTDPACTLVWVDEDNAFAVHRRGEFVGSVTAHTCHNPTTPLVLGWNKLLPSDEETFVVSTRRQHRPKSGIITTLPRASDPMRVWALGRAAPQGKTLVILQLHNKDPMAAYAAVSDTMENTFRLRLVAPSKCPSHTTEDLSFMIAVKGVYTADGDQMAEAGWGKITKSGRSTYIPFSTRFPATPVVLTTMRENTGALQDFIHSRVGKVNATGFTVVLETEKPHFALKSSWTADVNFFAIHTNGLITGLFGRRKYFAYVSSPPETITADFQTFTYPTDYHPEYLDTALFLKVPHVFVASQRLTHPTPVESRIGSHTTTDLSFAVREDTCTQQLDNVHVDIGFGIFSIAATGDKYSRPATQAQIGIQGPRRITTVKPNSAKTVKPTSAKLGKPTSAKTEKATSATTLSPASSTTPSTMDLLNFGTNKKLFFGIVFLIAGVLGAVAAGVKLVMVAMAASAAAAAV